MNIHSWKFSWNFNKFFQKFSQKFSQHLNNLRLAPILVTVYLKFPKNFLFFVEFPQILFCSCWNTDVPENVPPTFPASAPRGPPRNNIAFPLPHWLPNTLKTSLQSFNDPYVLVTSKIFVSYWKKILASHWWLMSMKPGKCFIFYLPTSGSSLISKAGWWVSSKENERRAPQINVRQRLKTPGHKLLFDWQK